MKFSPYLIIQAASEHIVNGSFIVFITMLVLSSSMSFIKYNDCQQSDFCGSLRGILHQDRSAETDYVEKPGKLTDEEYNIMKEHAYYTWVLLKDIEGFEQIAEWAAHHHEKMNGKGYPFHMHRNELSLGARIMTIADIFLPLPRTDPTEGV